MKKGATTTATPTNESNNNVHKVNPQSHVIKLLHAEIHSYKKAFVAKKIADEAVRNHTLIMHAIRELKHQLLQIKGSESMDRQIKEVEALVGACHE